MHLPPVASLAVMFPELKRGGGGWGGVQGGVNNALNNVAETVMNGDGAGRREKKTRAARDEGRTGGGARPRTLDKRGKTRRKSRRPGWIWTSELPFFFVFFLICEKAERWKNCSLT